MSCEGLEQALFWQQCCTEDDIELRGKSVGRAEYAVSDIIDSFRGCQMWGGGGWGLSYRFIPGSQKNSMSAKPHRGSFDIYNFETNI